MAVCVAVAFLPQAAAVGMAEVAVEAAKAVAAEAAAASFERVLSSQTPQRT
jgi:hypothetical protein